MIYLIAIFTPPIYFIIKKKWLAAAITSALFVFSVCLFIVIPVLWPICAICAVWDLRKSLMRDHAKMIGQEVQKAMRQEQPPIAK